MIQISNKQRSIEDLNIKIIKPQGDLQQVHQIIKPSKEDPKDLDVDSKLIPTQ